MLTNSLKLNKNPRHGIAKVASMTHSNYNPFFLCSTRRWQRSRVRLPTATHDLVLDAFVVCPLQGQTQPDFWQSRCTVIFTIPIKKLRAAQIRTKKASYLGMWRNCWWGFSIWKLLNIEVKGSKLESTVTVMKPKNSPISCFENVGPSEWALKRSTHFAGRSDLTGKERSMGVCKDCNEYIYSVYV